MTAETISNKAVLRRSESSRLVVPAVLRGSSAMAPTHASPVFAPVKSASTANPRNEVLPRDLHAVEAKLPNAKLKRRIVLLAKASTMQQQLFRLNLRVTMPLLHQQISMLFRWHVHHHRPIQRPIGIVMPRLLPLQPLMPWHRLLDTRHMAQCTHYSIQQYHHHHSISHTLRITLLLPVGQ